MPALLGASLTSAISFIPPSSAVLVAAWCSVGYMAFDVKMETCRSDFQTLTIST